MADQNRKSRVEEAKSDEQLFKEVYDQILKEKPFAAELSIYPPNQVSDFYESLANDKVIYMNYSSMLYNKKQNAESIWLQEGMNCLKEIQRKKIFDLHCLWDAEKITLPDILINDDFYFHYENSLACTFIEPISQSDLEIYLDYVKSNNYEVYSGYGYEAPDYDDIREAYKDEDSEEDIPEWYEFHNSRTGKGVYFTFPMIRTEKEDYYRKLALDERTKTGEDKQAATETISEADEIKPLPIIHILDKNKIDFIVSSFEDKKTQNIYKKYNIMYPTLPDNDYNFSDMMETLAQHGEIWPIEAHYDWREAFHNCYQSFYKHKILEALPFAFDEYKMFLEMNIPFDEEISDVEFYKDLNKMVKDQILQGRVLNNEPEDFNF